MKIMMKAAAIFCMFAGQTASADEHVIEILRYGYFPEKVYVSVGDTIKFVNESPNWAYITSNNHDDNYSNYVGDCNPSTFGGSQDGWWTNWIPRFGSVTVTVTPCMEDEIEAPNIYRYRVYDGYNEAWIVFGSAPTGD